MSNVILNKSFDFAVSAIRIYKNLIDKNEFILSKQFLRSATSVGANVREAQRAQSKKDFLSKINISLKEAEETLYWSELLYATDYINKIEFKSINSNCLELIKILANIISTTKRNLDD